MSDLKFHCPRCNQKIQCDPGWAGHKLQCPSCQGEILVPTPEHHSAPPPPPPPPPRPVSVAPPKATIARSAQTPRPAAPVAAAAGPGQRRPIGSRAPSRKASKLITFSVIAVLVAVGGYFGYGYAKKVQRNMNERADKAAEESGTSQLEHIAELHAVLDATDPNRFQAEEDERLRELAAKQIAATARMSGANATDAAQPMPERELPVIPAVWSLEPDHASIPNGRANGNVSGMDFVVESASLTRVGASYLLSLRQGNGPSPDREMQVYLRPDASGALFGRAWDVSGSRTAQTPQVIKRWKPDPKYAARQRSFQSGYVMKLELGQVKNERIPCKIFLALPDEEHSVVAGLFSIQVAAAQPATMDPDSEF